MFFTIQNDFHKPFHESLAKQYIKKFGTFDRELIDDLIERGYIDDFNVKGESLPELFVVRDEVIKMMKAIDDDAEELWENYPTSYRLPNGHVFNMLSGGVLLDKDNTKKVYLQKIKRSKKKHKFVMEMLEKYKRLLNNNEINAMKIGDWVGNELWNTVNKMKEGNLYGGIKVR